MKQTLRENNGSGDVAQNNNVFNPEGLAAGDVVVKEDEWDAYLFGGSAPKEVVVCSVTGKNDNKVYVKELGYELYASCYKLVRKLNAPVRYWVYKNNPEGAVRNGSFTRMNEGRAGYAVWMNGDFMEFSDNLPAGLVEVPAAYAERLLPKCCLGNPPRSRPVARVAKAVKEMLVCF